MAGGINANPVDSGRRFAAQSRAAVPGKTAIGIAVALAPGHARVRPRPATHERAVRVDNDLGQVVGLHRGAG